MRHVRHGLLLVGMLVALAAPSFGGTFTRVSSGADDDVASVDDGSALAYLTGLHW